MEPAQAAADTGQEFVPLIALDSEVTTRECLDHLALNLNEIVSCHATPFRWLPVQLTPERENPSFSSTQNGTAAKRTEGEQRDPYTNAVSACRYAIAIDAFP